MISLPLVFRPAPGTYDPRFDLETNWRKGDAVFIGPVGPPMWLAIRQPEYKAWMGEMTRVLPREVERRATVVVVDQLELAL